jgi:hypothetical protein
VIVGDRRCQRSARDSSLLLARETDSTFSVRSTYTYYSISGDHNVRDGVTYHAHRSARRDRRRPGFAIERRFPAGRREHTWPTVRTVRDRLRHLRQRFGSHDSRSRLHPVFRTHGRGELARLFDDTLNKALLKTVVSVSGADEDAFVGFALRPVVAPTVGQFYRRDRYVVVGASWQTLTTAMISDLTSQRRPGSRRSAR